MASTAAAGDNSQMQEGMVECGRECMWAGQQGQTQLMAVRARRQLRLSSASGSGKLSSAGSPLRSYAEREQLSFCDGGVATGVAARRVHFGGRPRPRLRRSLRPVRR